ncbi:hypothetical protein scyTo_0007877 [Scyliorhinus torazame]|uniref:Uncharacterized protein n=1 Tax=Scyliorhinus torazame TaxID=75743 RepID=A0A401NZY4_SCYTO|nr:hypothetical protein [Scyliorhinus torazame]
MSTPWCLQFGQTDKGIETVLIPARLQLSRPVSVFHHTQSPDYGKFRTLYPGIRHDRCVWTGVCDSDLGSWLLLPVQRSAGEAPICS